MKSKKIPKVTVNFITEFQHASQIPKNCNNVFNFKIVKSKTLLRNETNSVKKYNIVL